MCELLLTHDTNVHMTVFILNKKNSLKLVCYNSLKISDNVTYHVEPLKLFVDTPESKNGRVRVANDMDSRQTDQFLMPLTFTNRAPRFR